MDRSSEKVHAVIMKWLNKYTLDNVALFSVVLFVSSWLFIGNFWSVVFTYWTVNISYGITILSAIIYLIVVIPVIVFFFIEILRLKSRLKWVIVAEVITFFAFVIAPPRNADAMRVWLAKVYDVWMHGKKIVRPYWHYNTPDAFTLFHLPLINLWDGQIFQLSIFTAVCALLIIMIKIGRFYIRNDRHLLLAICLFIFNPLIILASTVVISDIPIILAVAGLIYAIILYERRHFNKSLLLVALFVAFGMNIKYNMLMFLPVVLYWSAKKVWKDGIYWKLSPFVALFIGLSVYPYLMNYLNIGNPVWPALVKYFPGKNPYWDEMALFNAEPFLGGVRNLWSFVQSFYQLFIIPYHINPLAIFTVFFVFKRFKYLDYIPAIIVIIYFFVLWRMMPRFSIDEKERYVLYLLPILIPFGMSIIYNMVTWKKMIRFFKLSVISTIWIYLAFTFVYSKDVFSYIFTLDKAAWHRATWYYEDYQWINKNIQLDKGGHILVIVSAQQTYYLRMPYVNGEQLSALINWRHMTTLKAITAELNKYNIQYIFVDEDYVKGNEDIKKALDILLEKNVLTVARKNLTKLVSSRLKGTYSEKTTVLYKVNT